jgi:hypothetical protein
MHIFIILAGLLVPRAMIVLLWFFTNWFSGVFRGWLLPVLGFIFLPATLLWYSIVQNWFHGVWGLWQVAGLVIALILDVSPAKAGRRDYR